MSTISTQKRSQDISMQSSCSVQTFHCIHYPLLKPWLSTAWPNGREHQGKRLKMKMASVFGSSLGVIKNFIWLTIKFVAASFFWMLCMIVQIYFILLKLGQIGVGNWYNESNRVIFSVSKTGSKIFLNKHQSCQDDTMNFYKEFENEKINN